LKGIKRYTKEEIKNKNKANDNKNMYRGKKKINKNKENRTL
jgi:hypothetical protein